MQNWQQQHHQSQAGRSIFMSSVIGLSNVIAVVVAFFATPVAYERTVGWVQRFTASHYGYGFEDITAFVWWLIVALLIFFSARASISTALVMGGLAVAARFL
jgi:uncharacterized membrane protein